MLVWEGFKIEFLERRSHVRSSCVFVSRNGEEFDGEGNEAGNAGLHATTGLAYYFT